MISDAIPGVLMFILVIIIRAAPVAEWLRVVIFHYHTKPFDHLTTVSSVGSSSTWGTRETSTVLLAGVLGVFSQGSPVFAPPTDWPVSYELK